MTEIIIMVVARNLRQRRKKAGLTQKMVACLLGLESATICRMEKGHNAVSLKRLQQFADLYGCTVIDFLQPPPRRPDPPGMKQSGFLPAVPRKTRIP